MVQMFGFLAVVLLVVFAICMAFGIGVFGGAMAAEDFAMLQISEAFKAAENGASEDEVRRRFELAGWYIGERLKKEGFVEAQAKRMTERMMGIFKDELEIKQAALKETKEKEEERKEGASIYEDMLLQGVEVGWSASN